MIEHLKNIGVGLCCIGFIFSLLAVFFGAAIFVTVYPIIGIPVVVIFFAWALGHFLRIS